MFPQALGPHHEPQALERHAEQLQHQPLAKPSAEFDEQWQKLLPELHHLAIYIIKSRRASNCWCHSAITLPLAVSE
jgi:hypothetical protein